MVCPVGALTSKVSAGKGRAYEVDRVLTTCTCCGTGCTLELNVKDNQVVGVTSNRSEDFSPVNKGALCVKGRFGWDFINSPDRLTTPLIKENGEFREASWDEALDLVATRLNAIKENSGPDSMAVFTSPDLTRRTIWRRSLPGRSWGPTTWTTAPVSDTPLLSPVWGQHLGVEQ